MAEMGQSRAGSETHWPARAMVRVPAAWLAWVLWLFIAGCAGLTMALVAGSRSAPRPDWHPWALALVEPVSFVAFALPGLVVATRRPRNPVGWLLLSCGLGMAADNLVHAYGAYALVHHAAGGVLAMWSARWMFVCVTFPFFFLLLLFPDGRLPSARWRFSGWYMGTASALTLTLAALLPGPIPDGYFPSAENPLGVPALAHARPFLGLVTLLCTAVPGVLAVMSLLFRFRAGDALIRRQLEWVALAVLAATAGASP
ncbi:hypothetical protein [Streptomyces sp. MMS20-AI2-20]|uniref:hypothetical protein n=1 Tax=Streptomyces sp. MMS20-AI2-20 TaxID=2925835 RepID=UPI001F61B522|nr:hypothetical protein [Streptomyces sp. MMS20-AI2-20]MCI4145775.1 hypothetical protein [Streptomyces sp. MMS20-AI2-20]